MKRYKQLKEYDPVKMRQLYQKGVGAKSKQVSDWAKDPEMNKYKNYIIDVNDNYIVKERDYRLILCNGNIYSQKAEMYTHSDILGWLVVNGNLNINRHQFKKWHRQYPVPFICMYKPRNSMDFYFAESYQIEEAKLIKLKKSKFKKECNFIEKMGGNIVDKIYNFYFMRKK